MKTIQITIDEPLLRRLDGELNGSPRARSAFIRDAVHRELFRREIADKERQHAEGYRLMPVQPDEFEWEVDEAFWEEM